MQHNQTTSAIKASTWAAIHQSINLRGYESTVYPTAKAGKRTRKDSHYMGAAYKMIFNRCMLKAAGSFTATRSYFIVPSIESINNI